MKKSEKIKTVIRLTEDQLALLKSIGCIQSDGEDIFFYYLPFGFTPMTDGSFELVELVDFPISVKEYIKDRI